MNRREVIAALGAVLACAPPSRAQQAAKPVIGVLSSRSLDDSVEMLAAFRQGLSEVGFFEHQNVAIEYRWADGQYERLPAFAADLVRRQVATILAVGSVPSPLAAKAATSTIPIVFVIGGDPIKFGLVASLSQPGGNVTGVTVMSGTLTAKRLELLRELAPKLGVIACLVNPSSPEAQTQLEDIQASAHAVGQEILTLNAADESEINSAFVKLLTGGPAGHGTHWAGTAANELIDTNPDVLVVSSTALTGELLKRTRSIPVIFVLVADPVSSGFVESLAKPGGNATGFLNFEASIASKWVQLLNDVAGELTHIAIIFNPQTAISGGDYFYRPFEAAAVAMGIRPQSAPLDKAEDIGVVVAAIAAEPKGAIVVGPDLLPPLTNASSSRKSPDFASQRYTLFATSQLRGA